jgi:hypothetical protein
MKKFYYLFGAGNLVEDIGFDGFVEMLKQKLKRRVILSEYATFEYDVDTMHPEDLLSAFDGWRSFIRITEEQFEILNNL